MDIQKFIKHLPNFYHNWGTNNLYPKSQLFKQVLEQILGMTTDNTMQLLNVAVDCLEPGEVYCEIGCLRGASLIGAMLEHPAVMAYVVDDFSEFDPDSNNLEILGENLANFKLEEQVYFCQQDYEEFFSELVEVGIEDKIGVYHYDGARDYRSVLLGLMKVVPFLAERALIVVSNSNYAQVKQAVRDFSSCQFHCQELLELSNSWILAWDINQEKSQAVNEKNDKNLGWIDALREEQSKEEKKYINQLDKQAGELLVQNQYTEAEQKYKEILLYERNNSNTWMNLGIIYYLTERYQAAINALNQGREIEPNKAEIYYNLGLVWEKISQLDQAIGDYQKAIELNPEYLNAYNNLGNIYYATGKIKEAESIYHQAIKANPNHFGSYLNLGNILMAKKQWDEAIEIYLKALEINKNNPDILYNIGLAYEKKGDKLVAARYFGRSYYRQGNYEEAFKYLAKVLNEEDDYYYLGFALKRLNREEESLQIFERGIKRYPNNIFLHHVKIETLQMLGDNQGMLAAATEACNTNPDDLSLYIKKQLILPLFYETIEQIEIYRQQFIQGLQNVIERLNFNDDIVKNQGIEATKYVNLFFLSYQGYNDRELHQEYGDLIHKIMAAKYPGWILPMSMPSGENGKIKIGYISESIGSGSVSRWLLGWLKNGDQEKVEIYCYQIGIPGGKDTFRQRIKTYSNYFYYLPNLEAACQQILKDNLHILVYLAIGLEAETTQIAALRLAPIQCSTWGNPVTSGLPTIDYFLSSELMEPANAQEHYTEQLIKLPNIGISYPKPLISEATKKRADFQLRDDKVVYLSCQLTYKYLPQHDRLFPEIALRVPQAQFVFILRSTKFNNSPLSLQAKFKQRLQQAFTKVGLNSEDYCIILPGQDWESYTSLLQIADVFLDTLSFSGGHTTFEAVASNLPIVTSPGELMRARQSSGILQMLGVTDTIAQNEAEYIDIAVRLGLDEGRRKEISQRMSWRHDYLFEDKTCVRGLEEFYQQVVQEKLAAQTTATSKLFESGKKSVLHVGCGPYRSNALPEIFRTDEWQEIRLDINPEVRPDIIGTITDLSAVPNESVDAVFSSHNLEHIYNYEVPQALGEFKRVLKLGGLILIVVPDMQAAAKLVVEGDMEEKPLYQSPAGPVPALWMFYGMGTNIPGIPYMAHKTGFTAKSLRLKLFEAGFCDVEIKRKSFEIVAKGYKQ